MAFSMVVVAIAVALSFLRCNVLGYPGRAPNQACTDMVPLHGVPAQTSVFPYTISLSSTTYCSTSVISVTISGGTFKGFFCQARPNPSTYQTVGKLTGADSRKNTNSNSCPQTEATLTQSDSSTVTSVKFTWTPGTTTQNVYIVCTVVQNRTSFWVRNPSATALTRVEPPNCPTSGLPTVCGSDEVCDSAVKLSVCDTGADDDGDCVCPSDMKFVNPTDTSCSPKVLGDSCDAMLDCKNVAFSTCDSVTRKCVCTTGFVQKEINRCASEKVSDVTCQTDSDCTRYTYARCGTTGKCQCTQQVKEVDGKCVVKELYDPCDKEYDCSEVPNADCDMATRTCRCRSSYLVQGNLCVLDPTSCTNDTCRDVLNSVCSLGNCNCLSAFKKRDGQCVPKGLDDSCTTTSDCSDVSQSVCSGGICSCSVQYIEQGIGCVQRVFNDTCTKNEECGRISGSICGTGTGSTKICTCANAYKQSSSGCIRKGLSDSCTTTNDCSDVSQSVCSGGTCVCSAQYKQQGIKCVPIDTGDVCKADTCDAIPHSVCYPGSTECLCLSAYKKRDGQCVSKGLGDSCGRTDDCNGVVHSVCNTSGLCGCPSAYKQSVDGKCEMKGLGDRCGSTGDCSGVTYSVCNANGFCGCPSAYKQSVDRQCQMKGLTDSCTVKENCRNVLNSECDIGSKRCVCQSAFMPEDGKCKVRGIGEICVSNEYCRGVLLAICDAGRCACPTGYKEQNNRCVPEDTEIKCNTNTDCSAVSGAFCDTIKTKTCVCTTGYRIENNRCVQNVLGDRCAVRDDCKWVTMSVCDVSNRCACASWFKQRDSSHCDMKGLGDSCRYNDDCRGTSFAMCDKENTLKCMCRQVYKQKSNQGTEYCEVRGIGETCTNDGDCQGILKATCDTGRCTCPRNHKVYAYSCVPKVLNKGCTENEDCKAISYAMCINKQCACAYGYNTDLAQDKCKPSGYTGGAISGMLISTGAMAACLILQACFGLLKYI